MRHAEQTAAAEEGAAIVAAYEAKMAAKNRKNEDAHVGFADGQGEGGDGGVDEVRVLCVELCACALA